MAALIETVPWIVAVGRHRTLLFGGSTILLGLNYWMVEVRPRQCAPGDVCHVDSPFMRLNRRLYRVSLALFILAIIVTYGSLLVVRWMH